MSVTYVKLSQIDSLAGYAGLFLLNEAISDSPDVAVTSPVTWKVATAPAGRFSAAGIAADSTTPTSRSNSPCATLISPSLALVGHVPGTGNYVWLRSNNAEESRNRSAYPGSEGNGYWSLQPTELAVIQLATPVTTITPAPIALPSLIRQVTTLMAIEADRHISLHTNQPQYAFQPYLTWTSGADVLESGDSTKPIGFTVSNQFVVAGLVITPTAANNPGYYASTINSIAASIGETVTFYGCGADGGAIGSSLQSSLCPSLAGAV